MVLLKSKTYFEIYRKKFPEIALDIALDKYRSIIMRSLPKKNICFLVISSLIRGS